MDFIDTIYVRFIQKSNTSSLFIPPTSDDGGGGNPTQLYGQYDNFPLNSYYKGNGVKIGILDTGELDLSHTAFVGKDINIIHDTYDNLGQNGSATYDYYHIMMVAGIICGIEGYAVESSIYYVDMHSIEYPDLTGIELLLTQEVDIINLSISYYSESNQSLISTYNYLSQITSNNNVIFVAASGNTLDDYYNPDTSEYVDEFGYISIPASLTNIIAVGSIDRYFNPSDFSSFYTRNIENLSDSHSKSKPEIVAVGERSISQISNYVRGTSFSAPAVTGAIALLKQKYGARLNRESAIAILTVTANNQNINYDDYIIQRIGMSPIIIPNSIKEGHDLYERSGAGALDIKKALDYPDLRLPYSYPNIVEGEITNIVNILYGRVNQTLSIAISWNKLFSNDVVLLNCDIDILVYDYNNNLIKRSRANHGNLELIRLTLNITGYYRIKLIVNSNGLSLSSYAFAYDLRG